MPQSLSLPIQSPQAKKVVSELYAKAAWDRARFLSRLPEFLTTWARTRDFNRAFQNSLLKGAYIPVSPEKGCLLYQTARAIQAETVVEFGTSFGVSTLFLGSAMREQGKGLVISAENDESKQVIAQENIRRAGLSDFVELRLGDALETLRTIEKPIDLVLLDGWKDLYLPVLRILEPRLRTHAVVFADNIFAFKKSLQPYVDYVQDPANGYTSATLPLGDGFEYSIRC